TPLPDLVGKGYYFLGKDWLETVKAWNEAGLRTPPVMITVANRTETAARVEYAFSHKRIRIEELCDPEKILHIDSKVLDEAEAQEEPTESKAETPTAADGDEDAGDENKSEENGVGPRKKLTKKEWAELLRKTVDTVGREDQPGGGIQNVIS